MELQQHEAQTYGLVDFKYVLLTGAGFEVERRGVASVTSEGNSVQVLWCATIAARFKKTKEQLRVCAESFRVYADGIKVNKIDYNDKVRREGWCNEFIFISTDKRRSDDICISTC